MVSLRLADAPPALAQIHAEHLARQRRFRAALCAPKLPSPPPLPVAAVEPPVRAMEIVEPVEAEPEAKPSRLSIEDVLRVVCSYYGVHLREIRGERRTHPLVRQRQIAMYVSLKLVDPQPSLPRIGLRIGDRDHTTVLSSVRRIARLFETDDRIRSEVQAIAGLLGRSI